MKRVNIVIFLVRKCSFWSYRCKLLKQNKPTACNDFRNLEPKIQNSTTIIYRICCSNLSNSIFRKKKKTTLFVVGIIAIPEVSSWPLESSGQRKKTGAIACGNSCSVLYCSDVLHCSREKSETQRELLHKAYPSRIANLPILH